MPVRTALLMIVLGSATCGALGFMLGSFATSYSKELCHSAALAAVLHQLAATADGDDPEARAGIRALADSFARSGEVPDCTEIVAASSGR